jgi:hypothetical protein
MKREDRVEQLLSRDRELMTRLETATPDERPALLRQRKQVKSQMNLYGPAAVDRWMRQEFPEIDDADRHEEERNKRREARWAKNPELREKIRKAAVG